MVRKTEIDYVLRRRGGGRGGQRIVNPVTDLLRKLQLAGRRSADKFVPTEYLYNVPEVRLGVMQGLLDTDGGPVTQQGRTCRIQYTTTSPRLRDDMVFLVRSFGGVAYWHTRRAQGRKPGRARGRNVPLRSDAYEVEIRLPAGIAPFRLTRKRDLYDADGGGRPMRFIDSVEPAGDHETVCIRVAAADSLYATPAQMKMFLTRLGYGSQAVVNGDITQVDLEKDQRSGLVVGREILRDVEGIAFVDFDERDVVRHELVARIVRAYDRYEKK